MASEVLATKLRIPPPTRHLVHRDKLVATLEREIPSHRLTLVTAPAGYGKTTLLGEWAAATHCRVVWLTISESDNDFERFFRYLTTGWRDIEPLIAESPLDLLLGTMAPDRDAVLSAFINIGDEISEHTCFVLDDFHLIDDPAIHEALTFLIDHLPPALHVAMTSRGEPPLPLARYRARDQLFELGAADLRFSTEETAYFLENVMGNRIANDDVESLLDQTEGWIAGLQLAGLSSRSKDGGIRDGSLTGRHRFIADYLNQDVLNQQPEDVQTFLVQTCILDNLSGDLCNSVTGRQDSQGMLEQLEQRSLFLHPLDEDRRWYRYHRLFAEFLQNELERRHHAEEVVTLHRRAGRWYLENGVPDSAFHHAVHGADPELAIRIFERYMNIKLNSGELNQVAGWLEMVPAGWYTDHPIFYLFRAGLLGMMGDFPGGMQCLEIAERELTRADPDVARWQLAMVTSVRCYIACIQNDLSAAKAYADQALPGLREESRAFRATIYHALGDTYRRNGHWDEARTCYLQCPELTVGVPGYEIQAAVESVHVYGALADLELEQGRLQSAAEYWRQALAAMQEGESWGRLELPVVGWIYIRMAEILYEWNELPSVRDYLERGRRRAELGGDTRSIIAGHLLAARTALGDGDIERAIEEVDHARPLVHDAPFPDWVERFERTQIELWLAQNRLRAAVNWVDDKLEVSSTESQPAGEQDRLSTARVLIVKGDEPALQGALTILRGLIEEASTAGRAGIQIEALVLQAIAQHKLGDTSRALTSLERALRLAEPEGYMRLFVDLGQPMAFVLHEARNREIAPDYVDHLLSAFGPLRQSIAGRTAPIPEPLTDRELEILQKIAAGLTNPEIAAALFISPQTVKKHAASIYAKLGVHSRTEAAARARGLTLLR